MCLCCPGDVGVSHKNGQSQRIKGYVQIVLRLQLYLSDLVGSLLRTPIRATTNAMVFWAICQGERHRKGGCCSENELGNVESSIS